MRTGIHSWKIPLGVVILVVILVLATAVFVYSRKSATAPNLQIQVEKAWSDDVDSPSGMAYYLLEVNASNESPNTWHFNPTLLVLTTNASSVYSPATGYAFTPILGPSDVGPGQHTIGEVAFELPENERPVGLGYTDTSNGISITTHSVPVVSGIATRFDPSVHYMFNGTPASSAVATWAAITNQTSALAFFGEEPGYRNYSFVFFTGQKIYVTFTFYYYKFPYDPNTIAVTAVTSNDGYLVSDVLAWQSLIGLPDSNVGHPLPAYLTGYGAETSVTLLVTVPPGHPTGVLHFTVQWSS